MHDHATPPLPNARSHRRSAPGMVASAFLALTVPLAVHANDTPAVTSTRDPLVLCHLGFAGAQRTFAIAPTRLGEEPYPQVEGASLAFRAVNRLPPEPGAGVQISTYSMAQGTPFLLHQASYVAQGTQGTHGFTGLQVVREPVRGHELAYWCERAAR